jgi:hypothetical protein
MYVDFTALVVRATLIDLETGHLDSLRKLQDRFKVADEAVVCAWMSQPGNSVTKDSSSENSNCLTVAEINATV